MKKVGGYECTECGNRSLKWMGRCSECHEWGTVQEVGAAAPGIGNRTRAVKPPEGRRAVPITELTSTGVQHRGTGVGEFDRVLGGGVVAGAVILLSGEPGVGKSTLLLETAANIAKLGGSVLYISGEESTGQIRMRAERTGALEERLLLAAETELAVVLGLIEETSPQLLIIDSVQTLQTDVAQGIAGGPAQVREVAATLIRVAKARDLPLILVGHVTKDGTVAGPRLLEHLVDVVCHFEGDRDTPLRFLRTLKNRFGPTDEVGCFHMRGDGIDEVPDPSELFVSHQSSSVSGVCPTITMEGKRALPVEVQALVSPSNAPNPRRVTSGVENSRVAMILAVLEKHCGVSVADHDVYVSTVGGVKLSEPGSDLAIALAITSSVRDRALPTGSIAFGEISLAGDIRPVQAGEHRKNEAQRLGYSRPIDERTGTLAQATRLVAPDAR